jgi:hypothetical protein
MKVAQFCAAHAVLHSVSADGEEDAGSSLQAAYRKAISFSIRIACASTSIEDDINALAECAELRSYLDGPNDSVTVLEPRSWQDAIAPHAP